MSVSPNSVVIVVWGGGEACWGMVGGRGTEQMGKGLMDVDNSCGICRRLVGHKGTEW